MNIILLGGGDAGYYTLENGHLVHHGGWGVDPSPTLAAPWAS